MVSVRAARSKGNADLPDKRDPAIAAIISSSLSIVVALRKARGEREIAEIAAVPSITAVIYVTGRGPAWAAARSAEPAAAAITRSYDSAISTGKAPPIIRVHLAAKAAARAAFAGVERGNVTCVSSYPARSPQYAGTVLIVSQNFRNSAVAAPEYPPAVTYCNGVGEYSARRDYHVDISLAVTAAATAATAGTAVTACPGSAVTPSAAGTARSPRLYFDRDRSPRRAVDSARCMHANGNRVSAWAVAGGSSRASSSPRAVIVKALVGSGEPQQRAGWRLLGCPHCGAGRLTPSRSWRGKHHVCGENRSDHARNHIGHHHKNREFNTIWEGCWTISLWSSGCGFG